MIRPFTFNVIFDMVRSSILLFYVYPLYFHSCFFFPTFKKVIWTFSILNFSLLFGLCLFVLFLVVDLVITVHLELIFLLFQVKCRSLTTIQVPLPRPLLIFVLYVISTYIENLDRVVILAFNSNIYFK